QVTSCSRGRRFGGWITTQASQAGSGITSPAYSTTNVYLRSTSQPLADFDASASSAPAVDGREPAAVGKLLRVEMVHAPGVPALATTGERRPRQLALHVPRRRQLRHLERPNELAVLAGAVLREADHTLAVDKRPPRRARP